MNKIHIQLSGSAVEYEEKVLEDLDRMAQPYSAPADLDALLERIGDARYVLLGEASHGTSEYYLARGLLTQRLILEKGFSFVAVEGDWPDCYRVNRYVKAGADAGASAHAVLHAFERWPTWMWANWEIVAFAEWLRQHNAGLPDGRGVGFFGLDVYSLWESLEAVLEYLESVDPDAAVAARRAYRCFEPFGEDLQEYARAAALVPLSCEPEVVALLAELRRNAPLYVEDGPEAYFNAEQNALVARNAEAYYRALIRGGAITWNLRDQHMVATLERLMRHHGPDAKCVVWEHNTHIGDARATDMAAAGMVNVGQLVRQRHATKDTVLIGFGSHQGSVIAGRAWGAPMERLRVPSARPGSWEDLLHRVGAHNKLLIFGDETDRLREPRAHRAIGVVYNPEHERSGNYVPTLLPRRYDAFVYLDETRALHPLHIAARADGELPATYPWTF